MSGAAVAAKRYAKALLAVAQEKGTVDQIQSELRAVAAAIRGDSGVQAFLNHPNIGADAKASAMKAAVGDKISVDLLNLLQLLIERGRGGSISEVSAAYDALADEVLGRARAEVVSAHPLTQEQLDAIARKFSALSGKQVSVEASVDSSLLGGIRVRIGDTLYDGSLAVKLNELERSFNKAR